jgi:hypothetical protein
MSMMPRSSGAMMVPTPPSGVVITPVPGSLRATTPATGVAQTMSIDRDSARVPRPTSIAESAPIPRKWLTVAAIIVLVAVAAAMYLLASRAANKGTTNTVVVPVPIGGASTVDHETRLKAALHDLETGKTCADRKAAIPTLVELGDKAAIPALRHARYRGSGGLLGIGESNANACLKLDAEKAIESLGGTLR